MQSFTNHNNSISIDRLLSKTKIGKASWYFNSSPQLQRLFFLIKKTKNNHSSASDWWEYTKSKAFSKNSTTQGNVKILRLKEDCKTYTKKSFKPELNQ